MRLFVAVDLPGMLRERLAELLSRLRTEVTGPKWVRSEGIHLTLRFIGEVDEADLPRLTAAVSGVAWGDVPAFDVAVRGLGQFPEKGRPRVLWIGLHEAGGALAMLQSRVERAVDGAALPGVRSEERPFRPHLTLARMGDARASIPIKDLVQRHHDEDLGVFKVVSVTLFQSLLHPSGARYRPIREYGLGGAAL